MPAPSQGPAGLLIVDSHPLFRLGLRGVCERSGLFGRIEEASTGAAGIARLGAAADIDLVIFDLCLPDMDGIHFLEEVCDPWSGPRFLALSEEAAEEACRRAFTVGAAGFAARTLDPELITEAARLILGGQLFLEAGLLRRFLAIDYARGMERDLAAGKIARLSPRERTTLDALLEGLPAKAVAERFGLSLRTVENYQSSIYAKLEARSPVELVLIALKAGLVKP